MRATEQGVSDSRMVGRSTMGCTSLCDLGGKVVLPIPGILLGLNSNRQVALKSHLASKGSVAKRHFLCAR